MIQTILQCFGNGTPKAIDFPFVPNGKSMFLGISVFQGTLMVKIKNMKYVNIYLPFHFLLHVTILCIASRISNLLLQSYDACSLTIILTLLHSERPKISECSRVYALLHELSSSSGSQIPYLALQSFIFCICLAIR